MPLAVGARLGPYEVVGALGAGGMGEVYRATDTKLKRQVAIKVLPPSVVADADRLARFQREAEVLASLNHPNIASIYGLEEGPAEAGPHTRALVMELVEGEDLLQKLEGLRAKSGGQDAGLPLDEALAIAKQIADALEAAHEQGIIHRDLKPANIKVRPDGTVKVLDFGLAKAIEGPGEAGKAGPAGSASMSPTITTPAMTQMGMILGTAAYMAPEQARGKNVDKRADIWAFGAVLFEMLTGRRAFDPSAGSGSPRASSRGDEANDLSMTLATVLMKDPEWATVPATIPPGIQRLLKRCLVKDPRQRIRDMGDVRLALEGAFDGEPAAGAAVQQAPPTPVATRGMKLRRVAVLAGVAVGAAALAAAGVWFATRPIAPRVTRTTIAPSGPAALTLSGSSRDLAISPDGSRVVYVGNNSTQIFVRSLDALEPAAILSGSSLRSPFVSPDGQWVGFFENNALLKKVAISGGPAIALATLDGGAVRGATWLPDDTIVVATANIASGLLRVPAEGGAPAVMTRPDPARGESDHHFPEALPRGRAVLFTITGQAGGADAASIAAIDLATNTQTILVRGGSHAQFVAPEPGSPTRAGSTGHLVYTAGGTLRAVPFDPDRLAVLGPAVPVVPQLVTMSSGAGDFAIGTDGTLVYADAPGTASSFGRKLVWVDRAGKEEPIAAPPRLYQQARVSPDGTRLALFAADQEQDIWTWDLRRLTLTRLTFDPTQDQYPIWTPDGRRIAYTSQRGGGQFNLWWQAADGTGTAERLTTSVNVQAPNGTSLDGMLQFHEVSPTMARDLMGITLDGSKKITPLLQTKFDERDGVVSPDGRWLAYGADDSGRSEVYVRPFPDAASGKWQVSTGGGKTPLWSHDSKELFFFAADGALMRVAVEATATTWSAGAPTKLLEPRYDAGSGTGGRTYDISPDGKRFVMIKLPGADSNAPPPTIVVVQHFDEELKRLAPAK